MMHLRKLGVFIGALVACIAATHAAPPALVMGNNAYANVTPLANAVSDANSMAKIFAARGFQVTTVMNADAKQMRSALRSFVSDLAAQKSGAIYFAGHGVQVSGENYLIPIDHPKLNATNALATQAINVSKLLTEIGAVQPKAVAVILDSCRDNPFEGTQQPEVLALGEIGRAVPPGVFIAYSASAGQAALDATPQDPGATNGLFVKHFSRVANDPTLDIKQIFRRTRVAVLQESRSAGAAQLPSSYNALADTDILLRRSPNTVTTSAAAPSVQKIRLLVPVYVSPLENILVQQIEKLNVAVTLQKFDGAGNPSLEEALAQVQPDETLLLWQTLSQAYAARKQTVHLFKPAGMVIQAPLILVASRQSGVVDLASLVERSIREKIKFGSNHAICGAAFSRLIPADRYELVKPPGSLAGHLQNGTVDVGCMVRLAAYISLSASGNFKIIANLQEAPLADTLALTQYASQGGRVVDTFIGAGVPGPLDPSSAVRKVNQYVPSAQQQGFAFAIPNWYGLFVPGNLPDKATADITQLIGQLAQRSDFQRLVAQQGFKVVPPEDVNPAEIDLSLVLAEALVQASGSPWLKGAPPTK